MDNRRLINRGDSCDIHLRAVGYRLMNDMIVSLLMIETGELVFKAMVVITIIFVVLAVIDKYWE